MYIHKTSKDGVTSSQASEQSSHTIAINQHVIVDSTSNVTVLSGKQSDGALM